MFTIRNDLKGNFQFSSYHLCLSECELSDTANNQFQQRKRQRTTFNEEFSYKFIFYDPSLGRVSQKTPTSREFFKITNAPV